ncbi:MAG: cytochrome c oxidase subunit I [Egibacteraceae bacterium]
MTTTQEQPTTGGSAFRRPKATTGFGSWFTTIDHKKIGILYFATAFLFFSLGGIEALLLRTQLSSPDMAFLTRDQYNQLFTMHGLTMIFFGVMPLGSAAFNYLLPLMIGARDVAFPRLNALSYWVFLFAGIFLYSSVLLGGAPDGGWFAYAPLNVLGGDPLGETLGFASEQSARMMFYSLGLQLAGIASLASAVNFIVTILNMRAPGMTLMRMPVFIWMTLVTSVLMLFAMPVIGVALWQLMFDIGYGANFFNPALGGDPVLWQHMFWLFGHPEVYIIILPAFGIISEVLPVFSRKPLFGYTAIVFSGIAIGFMGWGVWAHHMFAVGLGPVANAAFALSTMFIAVPTGIKIFNWLGTMWGGQIRFRTPMLFAIGMVAMFTIGGLSGVTHAIVPHNYQQTDTYYVVAHFHYVMFGGAVFGLMAGFYYWFPKVKGRMMDERLGKLHFWLMLVGFNLAFGPMHVLGLQGMPRRVATYPDGMGWNLWNLVATVGGYMIALGFLVFVINVLKSRKGGLPAGDDPWDARTLEWSTTSPPPVHNFNEVPVVRTRDDFWNRKYASGDPSRTPLRVPSGGSGEAGADAGDVAHDIHMPDPSYYPLVAAFGMPIMAYGVLFTPILIAVGGVITIAGLFGWALEPSAEEH